MTSDGKTVEIVSVDEITGLATVIGWQFGESECEYCKRAKEAMKKNRGDLWRLLDDSFPTQFYQSDELSKGE